MPKLKTKSSVKRRFRLTATGKVRLNKAFRRHMQRNKPRKMLRQTKGTAIMEKVDAKVVKRHYMPNG